MFKSRHKAEMEKRTGDITPFQALMTALAATVGNGNIAGVATAIASGGPGAPVWNPCLSAHRSIFMRQKFLVSGAFPTGAHLLRRPLKKGLMSTLNITLHPSTSVTGMDSGTTAM